MQKKPSKKRKYINRRIIRGSVSIFMALVISPILSITLVLVEAARYQQAMESMQEIVDVSAFSALANYDSYLDERFGLVATSQDEEISAQFSKYMGANENVLGKAVTLSSKDAKGAYALSDVEVLKQQILEFGEISVLTEVVSEGLDLSELLEELEKALKIDKIKDQIDKVNDTVDLAKEVEAIIENIVKISNEASVYNTALAEYKTAYGDFKSDLQTLIDALQTAKSKLDPDEDVNNIYGDSSVKSALSDAKKTCNKYKEKVKKLKESLDKMAGYIDSLTDALAALPDKLASVKDALKDDEEEGEGKEEGGGKEEGESAEGSSNDASASAYEWIDAIASQITKTLNDTLGEAYINSMNNESGKLEDVIDNLEDFGDKTVSDSWDDKDIEDRYWVDVVTVSGDFKTMLDNLISELDSKSAIAEAAVNQLYALLNMGRSLLDINGTYDASLNARVNPDCMYTTANMSITATLVMNSITSLIDAGEDFVDGVKSCNVVKAIKVLIDLLEAVASFLAAIVTWAGEALINLGTYLVSGPKVWYDDILLYGYGAYNMPNRTNCRKGSSITGYSYSKVADLAGGAGSQTFTGSLKDLAAINDNTPGADKMFKGAHAEYLIAGSNSEIANQTITFFDLYLFRLLLNLYPVLKDKEVTAMAAATGPGAWVVKLVVAIGEPMIDSLLLVNGVSVNLIKKVIYLTPSGLPVLLRDLTGLDALSDTLQDKLKDVIKANATLPDNTGYLNSSYTEHVILLLLLSVKPDEYMRRMQNLIQMEAGCKYQDEYSFTLDNANTYVIADVDYKLNPMFNIDGLTDNGPFEKSIWQCIGY